MATPELTRSGRRQRIGGYAALFEAGAFVFGFLMAVTVLSDYTTADPTPAESVAFLVDHEFALFLWYLVILIAFGVALVPLVLALYERLRDAEPLLAQASAAFGLIWAGLVLAAGMVANVGLDTVSDLEGSDPGSAETVWSALDSVENGLGGGNEVVGGVWVLLVSVAALRTAVLPRGLGYLGIVSGAAGIVTVIPGLTDVGAIFGLGLIAWFAWAGVTLLRADGPRDARSVQRLDPDRV